LGARNSIQKGGLAFPVRRQGKKRLRGAKRGRNVPTYLQRDQNLMGKKGGDERRPQEVTKPQLLNTN